MATNKPKAEPKAEPSETERVRQFISQLQNEIFQAYDDISRLQTRLTGIKGGLTQLTPKD